jgi:hypothetical protein
MIRRSLSLVAEEWAVEAHASLGGKERRQSQEKKGKDSDGKTDLLLSFTGVHMEGAISQPTGPDATISMLISERACNWLPSLIAETQAGRWQMGFAGGCWKPVLKGTTLAPVHGALSTLTF